MVHLKDFVIFQVKINLGSNPRTTRFLEELAGSSNINVENIDVDLYNLKKRKMTLLAKIR